MSDEILAIDVGGSHVKIRSSAGGDERRIDSGPTMTAAAMADAVEKLADGLAYERISIGYPGPVVHNRILADPHNLGAGWVGFDFAARFGKPVKLFNDALMQAIGSYDGGRMLFLGLGTGLGAAMIVDKVAQPMEIAHLPYRKGRTFEDYLGEASLEKRGLAKWRKHVFEVTAMLVAALEPDYVVIGGGNVEHLNQLPPKARRGDNAYAFDGGFRLWTDPELRV
ncbi:ROK family protein [Devosia sp.]|uniref:ROK family protein n=1 Tax=Devosia sp. TaxID=1871048 RepID=UPI003BA8A3C7